MSTPLHEPKKKAFKSIALAKREAAKKLTLQNTSLRVLEAEAAAEVADEALKSAKEHHAANIAESHDAFVDLHKGKQHLTECTAAFTTAKATLDAAKVRVDKATAQVKVMLTKWSKASKVEQAANENLCNAKGDAVKQATSTWEKACANHMEADKDLDVAQDVRDKHKEEFTAAKDAFMTAQGALVTAQEIVNELEHMYRSRCILRTSAAVEESEREAKETHQTLTSLKRKHE